jgi:RNA polymerase sigma-70 factor (ECF subfamily)
MADALMNEILLQNIAQNKEQVFHGIIENSGKSLYRICMAYLYDKSYAADLYQEILLQIWNSLEKFRGEAGLNTWIYRVAVNTAISWNLQARNKQHLPLPDTEWPDDQASQHEPGRLEDLHAAIQQLDPPEKLIISLVLEEMSYKEIAEVTGSTVNHIGVKINRIKAKIFKELKKRPV